MQQKISDRLRNGKQWRRWFCTHPAVTFGRSRGAYGVDRWPEEGDRPVQKAAGDPFCLWMSGIGSHSGEHRIWCNSGCHFWSRAFEKCWRHFCWYNSENERNTRKKDRTWYAIRNFIGHRGCFKMCVSCRLHDQICLWKNRHASFPGKWICRGDRDKADWNHGWEFSDTNARCYGVRDGRSEIPSKESFTF